MSKYNFSEVSELLGEKMVTIGISVSGGGYRSMLSGAGVLSAMDIRTPNSENHLGGILQSSTYIAGNSGGLWLVANNLLNTRRFEHKVLPLLLLKASPTCRYRSCVQL